jgi:carboxyl-terminal processing protease
MRLTTARYYTPSGRSIQAKGIEPDILVDPAKIEKVAVGAAVHEADLRGALKNTDKVPAVAGSTEAAPANVPPGTTPAAPAETGSVEPLVLGTAEDYQLARALDLLRGVALFSARRKDSELNRAAVVP